MNNKNNIPFRNGKKEEDLSTLTAQVSNVSTQLADIATLESFSGTNDTERFKNACASAISSQKALKLTKDITLDANVFNNIEIPTMFATTKVTITVNTEFTFIIGSNCKGISNITINDGFVLDKGNNTGGAYIQTTSLFTSKSGLVLDGLIVENLRIINSGAVIDGTKRTRSVFNVIGNNLTFSKIYIKGSRNCFSINNIVNNAPYYSNATFDNITMENIESGISLQSTKNTTLSNITYTNTKTQAQNSSFVKGADAIVSAYCDTIEINNLIVSYPVERVTYLQCTDNVIINGFIVKGLVGDGGIKFVGFQNLASTPANDIIAYNCKIENGIFSGDGSGDLFIFYNVDGVDIDNVRGKFTTGTVPNSFISASNRMRNLNINNCFVKNLNYNFWYSSLYKNLVFNSVNFTYFHEFYNITIKNSKIVNPVPISGSVRDLMSIYGVDVSLDDTFFSFDNFSFENNKVIQTLDGNNENVNYIETTSKLGRLIGNAVKISNVLYKDNDVKGCSWLTSFLNFGATSSGIKVLGDVYIDKTAGIPTAPQETRVSFGSEFVVKKLMSNGYWSNQIKVLYNSSLINSVAFKNLQGVMTQQYQAAASEVVTLMPFYNGLYSGIAEIFFDDGTYCQFKIGISGASTTLTKVSGDGTTGTNSITLADGSVINLSINQIRFTNGSSVRNLTFKLNYQVLNY